MKKVLAVLLTLAMVFTLAACTQKEEPAEQPAATTTGEAVFGDVNGDGVVKIGLNLCVTSNLYYMVWDSVGDICAERGYTLVTPTFGQNDKIIENVRTLLAQGIDALIDFGCNEEFQNGARELCDAEGVFVIGVDVSSGGGSSFVGANNAQAGIVLGETLGDYAIDNWNGEVDYLFISYAESNGSVVKLRTHGVPEGLANKGINLTEDQIFYLDKASNEEVQEGFKNFLIAHPDAKHIVVASVTEAQGPYLCAAADALGRTSDVVIGTNSESNVFIDYCNDYPGSAWWCTVAYSFEKYGDLCFQILDKVWAGEEPPKELLMEHVCITQENFEDWAWLADYSPKYA